jgi:hypothetical protein
VWAVAPSCWNHTCSVFTSSSLGRRKVSNISTYRSAGTVTVAPPSSKKNGPITPKSATAYQTVMRGEWSGRSWSSRGLRSAQ